MGETRGEERRERRGECVYEQGFLLVTALLFGVLDFGDGREY